MDEETVLADPTTSAATRKTEPAVQAAILSGDTSPDVPTKIETDVPGLPVAKLALLLVAGVALGYGVSRLWRS